VAWGAPGCREAHYSLLGADGLIYGSTAKGRRRQLLRHWRASSRRMDERLRTIGTRNSVDPMPGPGRAMQQRGTALPSCAGFDRNFDLARGPRAVGLQVGALWYGSMQKHPGGGNVVVLSPLIAKTHWDCADISPRDRVAEQRATTRVATYPIYAVVTASSPYLQSTRPTFARGYEY
jgi:hypothetical protein